MQFSSLLTALPLLATLASAQISLNAEIHCDQGPKDATLQSASAKKTMLNCVNNLALGLPPFQVGDFSGIRCGRNFHMFKKGSEYFKTNADCLKGCGACLREQANEGRRTGYCTYAPDTKKWPSAMCVVGWQPLNGQVCAVPK